MHDAGGACPVCGENPREGYQFFLDSSLTTSRRVAAVAAYMTFIPATFFLFSPRFRTDLFVRFHSFQSIFLQVALTVLAVIFRLTFMAFSFVPLLVATLLVVIFCLGALVLWMLLMVKALQGQRFKLPWIGEMAEKQAGS
jgi:uncharacterized membrane protein